MATSVMLQKLGEGMVTSLWIFAATLIFSLPLGLLISFGRMSKNKIISTIFKLYISVMRGTPLMLQLLVVYFGPYYLFGIRISKEYSFWTVLYFGCTDFPVLEEYGCGNWICTELCSIFCRNLSRGN